MKKGLNVDSKETSTIKAPGNDQMSSDLAPGSHPGSHEQSPAGQKESPTRQIPPRQIREEVDGSPESKTSSSRRYPKNYDTMIWTDANGKHHVRILPLGKSASGNTTKAAPSSPVVTPALPRSQIDDSGATCPVAVRADSPVFSDQMSSQASGPYGKAPVAHATSPSRQKLVEEVGNDVALHMIAMSIA